MKSYNVTDIAIKCNCEWRGICPHCSYKPDMDIFECTGCKDTDCRLCVYNKEGDTKRNKQYARELTAHAIQLGYAPITPHLYITECLNDNEPSQRDLGLNADIALLSVCEIIIVGIKYGISDGMEREIFRI